MQQNPERFWAYNNGVTALTKKIVEKNGKIALHGISVINGAQTTGVLGVAPRGSADKVRVAIRFIECDDSAIVSRIIDFNNTQNAIRSFDYRSKDRVQTNLRDEFKIKYEIEYVHRREGATRLPSGAIQAESLAPNLAAFHGKFQIATRQRDSIFEDDSIYLSRGVST